MGIAFLLTLTPTILAGGAILSPAAPDDSAPTISQDLSGAHETPSGPTLDQSWMQPGFTVDFHGHPLNAGTTGSPLDWFQSRYHLTDRNDDMETVTFSLSGSTLANVAFQAITVNSTTREEMPRNGRYTPLWINETNVATGEAYIGDEYAAMTPAGNPAFHQFATSEETFYYDRETGLLIGVVHGGTFRFAFQSDRSD